MFSKIIRVSFPIALAGIALLGMMAALRSSPVSAAPSAEHLLIQGPFDVQDAGIFQSVLNDFYAQTTISATYETVTDTLNLLVNCSQNGNCPDLGILTLPIPDGLHQLARQGDILALDDIVTEFDLYYSSRIRELSSYGNTLYGIPVRGDNKSLVWYRPQTFTDTNVSAPLNWTEWMSASQDLLDGGVTPFSIGLDSGAASGWPMTDWFENVLISSQGVDAHQRLVEHSMSWTDESVVESFDYLAQIFGNASYQVGGISGTLNTRFDDAITSVFTPTYQAGMYMGGTWGEEMLPGGLTKIDDYNTFDFPQIDPLNGQPVIFTGDFVMVFKDTSGTRQLIQYLASPEANELLVSAGFGMSPNQGVDPQDYPDKLTQKWAETIATGTVVFDLDDQLPRELGELIWGKFYEYVAHPDRLNNILIEIEAKATSLQGSPYRAYLPVTLLNQ